MRFEIATMALGLAIFTRQIQMRSVTAFQIGSSFQLRSFTSSSSSSSSSSTPSSFTTSKMGIMSLNLSAVQETTNGSVVLNGDDNDNMDNLFPQKGKNVEEAPPRMRFAPSPTGRYVLFLIFIYFFVCLIVFLLYIFMILT